MIIMLLTFLFSFAVIGEEIGYLVRSPKALLMGDAFTAAANDEFAIYYNPATLGNAKLVEFSLINPTFSLSNLLEDADKLDNLSSDPSDIATTIMNTPLFLQTMGGPVLKFGPVGFGLLANMKTNFILRNAVYPQLEIDYTFDKGFIFAYAHSWGRGGKYEKYNPYKRKKLSTSGYRFSLGASAKYIDRTVLSGNYSLFGVRLLNSITSGAGDLTQVRENLGYARGTAWGFDTGANFLYSTGRSELTFGLSILDIAGSNFTRTSGTVSIKEQAMIISSGLSFSQSFPALGYRLSMDLHPINSGYEFLRKLHLGGELSFPMIDVFFGYSSGYLSYGVQFDLWLMKITGGFYGVELGSSYREQKASRAVLQVSLFDFAYDI
jgi:hypothetical protein